MINAVKTDELRKEVCKRLLLDEEDVIDLLVDGAGDYLDHYYGKDHRFNVQLIGMPEFWSWWRQWWAVRDRQILGLYSPGSPQLAMVHRKSAGFDIYRHFHQVSRLTMHPDRVLLHECRKRIKRENQLKTKHKTQ
jgi:hypothetical protein